MSDTINGLGANALADVDLVGIDRANWTGPYIQANGSVSYTTVLTDAREPGTINLFRRIVRGGRVALKVTLSLTTLHEDDDNVYDVAECSIEVILPPFQQFYAMNDTMTLVMNAFSILLLSNETGSVDSANLMQLLGGALSLGA